MTDEFPGWKWQFEQRPAFASLECLATPLGNNQAESRAVNCRAVKIWAREVQTNRALECAIGTLPVAAEAQQAPLILGCCARMFSRRRVEIFQSEGGTNYAFERYLVIEHARFSVPVRGSSYRPVGCARQSYPVGLCRLTTRRRPTQETF